MMMRLGDNWMVPFCLEGLASFAVIQGEEIWAVRLLSAAIALRTVIGLSLSPLEQLVREQMLTRLHNQLDQHAFTTAWTEGQTMSPEQALTARNLFMLSSHSPATKKLPVTCVQPPCLIDELTPREREVLRLVAQGLTNAQVAERLVITCRTVNWYLTRIYQKIQVSSRSAATVFAIEHNLR